MSKKKKSPSPLQKYGLCKNRSYHEGIKLAHLYTSKYNGTPICSWCSKTKPKGVD